MKHRFTMKALQRTGSVFYRIASHLTLVLGVGLIIILLVKHLGLVGGIYAMWRRRSRQQSHR